LFYRHGRKHWKNKEGKATREHASARKEAKANAPLKRGCSRGRRGVQMVEGLVQGTHDSEAGSSSARRLRRRPTQVRVEEEHQPEDVGQ
jgi:hypothetical protein